MFIITPVDKHMIIYLVSTNATRLSSMKCMCQLVHVIRFSMVIFYNYSDTGLRNQVVMFYNYGDTGLRNQVVL